MNEDEVRRLFDRAASGPVDVDRVDPEAIVRAGKRGVGRRQIGIAVAGATAAVLALGAAVGIPMTLDEDGEPAAPGGAAPQNLPTAPVDDDFLSQWARSDHGDCPVPDGQTDEQERTAAAYNRTLFEALAELGAEPMGSCLVSRPDYDGLYYDSFQEAYHLEESVAFGGDASASDWALVRGGFWETGGVNYESLMELEECDYNQGADCSWEDTDEGRLLLIEGTRSDFINPDTEEGGSAEYPVVSAFLFRDDVVVTLGLSLRFESDRRAPSIDQVIDIVKSLPVGEDAPETDAPAEGDIADALAAAAEQAIPGIAVETDTAEFVRLDPEVAEYGGPVYGAEATHMVFVLAELGSGETVRLFLQAEQVADVDGDPAEAAALFAQCSDAECETAADGPRDVSVHRTIEGEHPSLTALEYRVGDGWMIGVGVETADGSETPPVDFATLDALVDGIR
ncbi:MAG TPA: hypothetical protein VHG10_10850 [Glycomyces sp.]|nr:hypothetical protein [Glycomyces sp.]